MKGYVDIILETNEAERFLNMCSYNHIPLWNIKKTSTYYEMTLDAKNLLKLKEQFKKTHSKIKIKKKHGLPFFLFKQRKRKAFFLGILLAFSLLLLMTQFIWNIHITGNTYYHSDTILRYLSSLNLSDITLKNTIDCHTISTKLREKFPKIIWVSTRIEGTNLCIEIKENLNEIHVLHEEKEPADIIADKNGTIVSIITRSGVPKVKVGQKCKKGDLLVSAKLDILDDNNEVKSSTYVASDADIKMKTTYSYSDKLILKHQVKNYKDKSIKIPYFRFGDYFFSMKSPFSTANREIWRDYSMKNLTESIRFPLELGTYEVKDYEYSEQKYTKNQAKSIVKDNFSQYLQNLEEKGVQILENNVKIYISDTYCIAKGEISVIEDVGKKSLAKIDETPPRKETTE